MSKLVRVLVFLGALVLVLAAMALLGARTGDRIALQQYLTELRAKGEKLTFADLTRGRQTNTNGSYDIITNAVAKFSGGRFYPGLLEVRNYVGPGQVSVTWRQASPTWMQSAGSASPGAWEEFATQMQAAQGALQEIREALKEPAADAGPCTDMLAGRRVNFVAIRYAAHWLMGAAENDLHQGRRGGGIAGPGGAGGAGANGEGRTHARGPDDPSRCRQHRVSGDLGGATGAGLDRAGTGTAAKGVGAGGPGGGTGEGLLGRAGRRPCVFCHSAAFQWA